MTEAIIETRVSGKHVDDFIPFDVFERFASWAGLERGTPRLLLPYVDHYIYFFIAEHP